MRHIPMASFTASPGALFAFIEDAGYDVVSEFGTTIPENER
jgi:hypothetical protein